MIRRLDIACFLEQSCGWPVLDVRTPAEFAQGHLPGAHNLPLFSNEERAHIGTAYKHEGRHEAMRLGLDVVGPKMRRLLEEAEHILEAYPAEKPCGVFLHCWRGGMRSGSVAWLLDFFGYPVATLEGGYKAFRRHVLNAFAAPREVSVLGGPTGSGKTDVLAALRDLGEQVIDLEGLARHKGSVFGGLGERAQPTQEQFENDLAAAWLGLDPGRRVWIEDESRRIGRRLVPREILDQMAAAPAVHLDVPASTRVTRLVEAYGRFPTADLIEATGVIQKRLGGLRTQQATEAIRRGDLSAACAILLDYYDRCYAHAAAHRSSRAPLTVSANTDDARAMAEHVLTAFKAPAMS